MKLLLMRPPSGLKKILPMGILYIAGYLQNAIPELDIEIIDLRQRNVTDKEISAIIKKSAPDVVGISAVNMEANLVHSMSSVIKSVDNNIKIIIGGPYATSLSTRAVIDKNVYCCVIGEGEATAVELIENIHNGNDERLSDIKGIAFLKDGQYFKTPQRDYISDLDSIPMPAYDLITISDYFRDFGTHSGFQAHREYSSIFSSRGCPYKCVYCHDIFGKKIRYHSPERILQEIRLLYIKYGVREIHIEDDSFNINKERVKKIFNMIIDQGLKIKISFPNGIRVDHVNVEILDLFKRVGVYKLAYGIESASPNIQKDINKNLDLELARKNIKLTAERGIVTQGFFMLGFLGETMEELNRTIDYAASSKLHMASFSFVIPQPGTPLYYQAIDAGFNFKDLDTDQLNPGDTELNISAVSIEDLHLLRRKAYRKFYLNPDRMYRLYKVTPKKTILFKSFMVFMTNVLPIPTTLREKAQAILYK
ncbi:MAG: radical SAM protein [Nitrospirae bacterium]|nr:radical SAM protein [Nitrospirota bacterium]MBF0540182.1 radical SAM protein [Nitrospirota bacterium]